VSILYYVRLFALSFILDIDSCSIVSSFNYELYFGFSWIFAFISFDRWIKVEWPTKSHVWCTRENYVYLCLITFIVSLIQNIAYTFSCFNDDCEQKNLACEIFIHVIYITMYMFVPIGIILVAITRTCLITIHLRQRVRTSNAHSQQSSTTDTSTAMPLDPTARCCPSTSGTSRLSTSLMSSLSSTTNSTLNCPPLLQTASRLANIRRRRSRIDAQMVVLISINVAPFILVHVITEIAYLFEKYSPLVAQSTFTRLFIIFIYLSWYVISATRFYTNCLLSRIYREEFKTRLYILRHGCKRRSECNQRASSRRMSSRYCIAVSFVHAAENTTLNMNHLQCMDSRNTQIYRERQ
jgi:7 transmembrane receptor (rhodopsin family)